MIDQTFLPNLLLFAKRTKKEVYADKEIAHFRVRMALEFSDLDSPLTYESIQDKVNLQLQPVLQEDLDKEAADKEESATNDDGKESGDA